MRCFIAESCPCVLGTSAEPSASKSEIVFGALTVRYARKSRLSCLICHHGLPLFAAQQFPLNAPGCLFSSNYDEK